MTVNIDAEIKIHQRRVEIAYGDLLRLRKALREPMRIGSLDGTGLTIYEIGKAIDTVLYQLEKLVEPQQ